MNAEVEVWPIGKYKGQPIEVVLGDRRYAEWCLSQPWFPERYSHLAAMLTGTGIQPEDTPEHNEMQSRFLALRVEGWGCLTGVPLG